MRKQAVFIVALLAVSVWCAPAARSQDVAKLSDDLKDLEKQLAGKRVELQLVEKQNQENTAKDQQLKRDLAQTDSDSLRVDESRGKLKRDLTNWSNARNALQSEGCAGRTTDRAFYNYCERKIAAVNAEHDRLEGERLRVQAAMAKDQAEVERINRERQALNSATLQHAAAHKRVVAEWNDLVARIKALQVALHDRCQVLLREGGSTNPNIYKQALKHCGNVTFDGADPNLKPLDR